MSTVATMTIHALADLGVKTVGGVVGDALNPLTEAIRREDRLDWIGVRHEEVAAFAAGAQSQLTGTLGVCMGTVGPGSIHLVTGLYDAEKSATPVLAICGQVPSEEIGSDFFQEINTERLFSDVAVFTQTVTTPSQMPYLLEQAVNAAMTRRGVAVLIIPGDIGDAHVPNDAMAHFDDVGQPATPHEEVIRGAKDQVLDVARKLAAQHALDSCDALLMVGTDFPYRDSYPAGKTVIQIDSNGAVIGRRTSVALGVVGDTRLSLDALKQLLKTKADHSHLDKAREKILYGPNAS